MSDCYPQARADPEIEREGGGGTQGWSSHAARARAVLLAPVYTTGDEAHAQRSTWVWGHAPPVKI